MATLLDPFSMFMLTTGPAFLKSDEDIINAVVKNSYLLPRFMEGKETELLLQGGTKIQDIIYLQEDSDAEFYNPATLDVNYRNTQVGTPWEVNWRYLMNKISWTDQEIGLNETGSLGDTYGKFHRFKRISKLRYMNFWTSQIHKMEDSLTNAPNREQMEDGAGLLPQSLFCFITSSGNISGLSNPGVPNQGLSASAWTEVQHINVTTFSKWKNQLATYPGVTSGGLVSISSEGWWTGMRELYTKCRFEQLPRFGSYSDPVRSPTFFAVGLWGLITAESSLRSPQDLMLAGRQDAAFPGPMFSGVPFVYVANLNTAPVYNAVANAVALYSENGFFTAGGSITGSGPTTDSDFVEGPRVVAINGSVVNLVMHRDRVIYRLPPFRLERQPTTSVMVTDTWYNLVCQNRRQLGILGPSVAAATDDIQNPPKPGIPV